MGTIQVQNLNFKYSNMSENLFNHVNLQIDESWKLGLIGRNGRGKTTLLNIIQSKLAYEGKIITNMNFTYFPAQIINDKLSTLEIVLQISGIADYELWKVQTEMDKLGLDDEILSIPYNQLSPGQQTKIQLAAMFVNESDFQLIDEPTNHLDVVGREVVEKYLKSKTGFIVISHDRYFLNQVIDHVISINRSDVTVYHGNFDTWEQDKMSKDKSELAQKEQLKSEIRKLKASAAKKENWSQQKEKDKYKKPGMEHENLDKGFIGSRAARTMKRAKQIEGRANDAIEDKQELLKNVEISAPLTMNYLDDLHNPEVLNAKDVQVSFADMPLNKPINFKLLRNEVVALIGENGAGKSTFIKKIMQLNEVNLIGSINIQNNLKISYLTQNANELIGTVKELCEQYNIVEEDVFSCLRKLGFERELFDNKTETMSQGQKKKVALAISLVKPADLYIWDEPLNYLDVITREQIIEVIKKFHPTMLVIDHDRDFLEKVSDQKVMFERLK